MWLYLRSLFSTMSWFHSSDLCRKIKFNILLMFMSYHCLHFCIVIKLPVLVKNEIIKINHWWVAYLHFWCNLHAYYPAVNLILWNRFDTIICHIYIYDAYLHFECGVYLLNSCPSYIYIYSNNWIKFKFWFCSMIRNACTKTAS